MMFETARIRFCKLRFRHLRGQPPRMPFARMVKR